MFKIKRIYEKPDKNDGLRILVDRLWPRGINKDIARVDKWMREIAPTNELRKWFAHKEELWGEFKLRYCEELDTRAVFLLLHL